jgi:voltage-gated potassium channel
VRAPHHTGPYDLFMLALSAYALLVLGAETVLPLDQDTLAILHYADTGVCLLFFADFLHSIAVARDRREYLLTWGWLDLLSSIPAIEALRISRIARVVRILRVLRGIRATRTLASFVLKKRAQGVFLAAAFLSILLVVVASIAILQFESVDQANIRSAGDAIWWAFATITTVGYGDRFPVTGEGRVLAAVLMTAGVGLFGVFSGFVAAWFLSPLNQKHEGELEGLRRDIQEIKAILNGRAKE